MNKQHTKIKHEILRRYLYICEQVHKQKSNWYYLETNAGDGLRAVKLVSFPFPFHARAASPLPASQSRKLCNQSGLYSVGLERLPIPRTPAPGAPCPRNNREHLHILPLLTTLPFLFLYPFFEPFAPNTFCHNFYQPL